MASCPFVSITVALDNRPYLHVYLRVRITLYGARSVLSHQVVARSHGKGRICIQVPKYLDLRSARAADYRRRRNASALY